MRGLYRALTALDAGVLRPAAGLALFCMMLAISLNALSRGLLDQSVGWVLPFITSLAMPAVVFLGLPSLTLADGHVRMEAVSDRLRPQAQVALRRFGWIVGIVIFAYIGYANALAAWHRRDHGVSADAVVPGWFQYGMTSVSCLLVALILLAHVVRPALAASPTSATEKSPGDV